MSFINEHRLPDGSIFRQCGRCMRVVGRNITTDPECNHGLSPEGDKMKPFDLQEALAGKPVVTRDGRKVARIHHAPEFSEFYRVIVVIPDETSPYETNESGRFVARFRDHSLDLFMASEKKEGWIVIGEISKPTGCAAFCTHVWLTEAQARASYISAQGLSLYSVQKVAWEE